MTVAASSTSTLRLIPQPRGLRSKSWKLSPSRPLQSISFGIVMPSTDSYFGNKSKLWALRKHSEFRDHPGNVPMSKGSSASTRLSRPRNRLQPIITSPNSAFLPRLLSRIENSPFARQGCSGTACGAVSRTNRRYPAARRTSPPIRPTSRLIGGPIPLSISSHTSTSQPLSVLSKTSGLLERRSMTESSLARLDLASSLQPSSERAVLVLNGVFGRDNGVGESDEQVERT